VAACAGPTADAPAAGCLTDAMVNADIAVVAGKIVAASAERWEFQVTGNTATIDSECFCINTVSIFSTRKPHAPS
jgi:hypothetical protein